MLYVLIIDRFSNITNIYLKGTPAFWSFFIIETALLKYGIYICKTKFETHLVWDFFYLVHRKRLIKRKRSFRII